MNATALLTATAELFERMDGVTWKGATFSGRLLFDISQTDVLTALQEEEAVRVRFRGASVLVKELIAANPIGEEIQLEITPPVTSDTVFAKSVADLLAQPALRTRAPATFYLAEERQLYPRDQDGVGSQYVAVAEAMETLRTARRRA